MLLSDIVYIPDMKSPAAKLNHTCLMNANNFTELCHCSLDKKAQPIKIDLNEKSHYKQNTIQSFNVDANNLEKMYVTILPF